MLNLITTATDQRGKSTIGVSISNEGLSIRINTSKVLIGEEASDFFVANVRMYLADQTESFTQVLFEPGIDDSVRTIRVSDNKGRRYPIKLTIKVGQSEEVSSTVSAEEMESWCQVLLDRFSKEKNWRETC